MKIYKEESLRYFEFWGGAVENAEKLTAEQLDDVEAYMEDLTPEEGWSEGSINDFFWFEFDTIKEWLGIDEEEEEE